MAVVVGDNLIPELTKYGVEKSAQLCYNCGKCTAVCGLTENGTAFPRKVIRLLQLGLKDELVRSTEPWMCYYCGECSDTCPRGAEPGEIMMGVRRYLTAEYDVTGQSKRLYTSKKAIWTAITIWFFIPIVLIGVLHAIGNASVVTSEVKLNEFAPVDIINEAAHVYLIYLSIILLSGMFRMWRKVMDPKGLDYNVKISDYVREIGTSAVNIITIKKWLNCGDDTRLRWFKHYYLAVSYVTMFVVIVVFLKWFQTDNIYPITNPQRWIGYIATLGLLIGTIDALIGRMRKKEELHKHSHHTDWMFPITVLLVTITGILTHILRYAGLPWPTYIVYTIHLGFTAVMLSTEVGIGKWTHIFYRPLGLYLDGVKKRASARNAQMVGN